MEENNSEQNIDHTTSTSQIDQITKVPDPKPKPKVKNPKRVAAGKKLSQYNKMAKAKQKSAQEENEEEENEDEKSNWLPETSFTSIITLLGLGLTAIDLFLRYKSQSNYPRTVENKHNQEPDESEYENVTKMKVINGPQHISGME